MTTALQRSSQNGRADHREAPTPGPQPHHIPQRRKSWLRRFLQQPAWPVVALLAGWPLWWILGVGTYIILALAIPMGRTLYRWQMTRTRRIKIPPGFGMWMLLILVAIAGVVTISQTAPETIASPTSHRVISWALRTGTYIAVGILLLYTGTLTEEELPRRRLAWLLGLVGLYTVAGGLAGVVAPNVKLTSPLALVIPLSIQANVGQLYNMLHPSLAEIQGFLGYAQGRPTAPFSYTNMWGNCLAILLPWLLVVWWTTGGRRHRWWAAGVLALAFVPAVYSLDRGLWIGVGVAVIYLALRFAARGKLAMLGGICGALVLAALVILASPLQNLIADRYAHGQSNTGRLNLTGISIDDAIASPVIGYGDTRHELGSAASIAIGRNANCKHCGNQIVGGNGQMQMLLIADGFVGAALYVGFFAYGAWRYRRDKTPYGITGVMVILMSFVYMGVYNAVGPPLVFIMLVYALLWKNDRELRAQRALAAEAAAAETGHAVQARTWRAITTGGA